MLQQRACLVIARGRGHNRYVHAFQLVDLLVRNLRKDQLVVQAEREVATPVERLARNSAEVAHARQNNVYQPVEKFVHAVAAQSHHRADRLALAYFERRNRLLGFRRDRFLAGDLGQFVHCRVEHFRVLRRFAHTHVHDDLMQTRNRHDVLQFELLQQSRSHFLIELRTQARTFLRAVPRLIRRLLLLRRFFLLLVFCHVFCQLPPTVSEWLPVRETYLSNVVPHFLHTRTLRSPRTSWPIRTGPQVGHTSCTLEIAIRLSCSAMPPLTLRCGFGRTCFFTIITCSTSNLASFGNTRSTRPSLPLSRPVITFTVSFRRRSTRLFSVLTVLIKSKFQGFKVLTF